MYGLTGTQLWAGRPEDFKEALEIAERAAKLDPMQVKSIMKQQAADQQQVGVETLPRLYSRIGNVGVISMHGSMINAEDAMLAYMGITTYPAIQEAVAFAASDAKVESVLLDINSGGGSVSGIDTTSAMLRQLGQVKPIVAFSDGSMYSAAMWLGADAAKIYGTPNTGFGSIGTVAVHAEETKAMADAGIKVTIIRSGKYKALGHYAEALSPLAEAEIQASVDASSLIFEQAMADRRGMSLPALQKIAQGRLYMAQEALASGLIDGIATANEVLSAMQKILPLDKSSNRNNNQSQTIRGFEMARTILTDEQVKLAIAAGADATTLIAENAEAKKLEGAILEPKEVAAAVANTPDDPAKIEVAAEAIVLATSTAPLSTSVEVDFLKAQLNVANQEIMNLRVSAQSAENKAKSDADAVTSLRKIAADSINNMNVSLRGSATAMDDLTAEQIVTSHKATLTRFLAEFKIGGVAASTSDENTLVKTKTAVSSLDQARVKAAKFGGNK